MKTKYALLIFITIVIIFANWYWDLQAEDIHPIKSQIIISCSDGRGLNDPNHKPYDCYVDGYFEPIDTEKIGVNKAILLHIEHARFSVNKSWYLAELNLSDFVETTPVLNLCVIEASGTSIESCVDILLDNRSEHAFPKVWVNLTKQPTFNYNDIYWTNTSSQNRTIIFSSEGSKDVMVSISASNGRLGIGEGEADKSLFVMERQSSIEKNRNVQRLEHFFIILSAIGVLITLFKPLFDE